MTEPPTDPAEAGPASAPAYTAAAAAPAGATALAGVDLLRRGVTATKFGRAGKPHSTLVWLSEDGKQLHWNARTVQVLGGKLLKGKLLKNTRSVRFADVLEV